MKNIKQKLSKINRELKKVCQMDGVFLLTSFHVDSHKETQLQSKIFLKLLKETNNSIQLVPRSSCTEYPFRMQLQYDGVKYFTLISSKGIKKLKNNGVLKGKIEDYIKKEERY